MQDGNILLIVNPAAQGGRGAEAGQRAASLLRAALGETRVEHVETASSHHAAQLAQSAQGTYESVVVCGGDGVIHEAAGGIMHIPAGKRPALGIVPVGTGNDYAQTLGMSTDVDQAVAQLLQAETHLLDVGEVNGEYFVETLSFGLDAAIGLDTMERRKHSKKTGQALYFETGLDHLLHHRDPYRVRAILDGKRTLGVQAITFAVQIGPTYGGGFRICPDAKPDDGLFDICYAKAPFSLLSAIYVFARARTGKHGSDKRIRFEQARTIELFFDEQPPAQADGERVLGTTFDIQIHNHALPVLMP